MKIRWLGLFLLALIAMPVVARAQGSTPASPHVLTFDVQSAQLQGIQPTVNGFRLQGGRGTLTSDVFDAGWEFMAVGVTWKNQLSDSATIQVEVRVSDDGKEWSSWQVVEIDEVAGPDFATPTFTELLFAEGRYIQTRATLSDASIQPLTLEGLQVTVIDGRPGPTAQELASQARPASVTDGPYVIPRSDWGANESYRFNSSGQEKWPREYLSLRGFFVHHTASPTSGAAAAVRSIYYYHAVTLGWGDIGYHYIVDEYGNIYQGRYAGEQNGLVAEGGHTLGYNRHTMGVSIIGNFTSTRPPANSLASMKELLAWRAAHYGINPQASMWLDGVGSISPDRSFSYSLLGHRDSHTPARTTCPGDAMYALMGEIRADVTARAGQISNPEPVVQLASPVNDAQLQGIVTIQANASSNVTRVEYFLDGSLIGRSYSPPWALQVDSRTFPAGDFTLTATGVTAQDRRASDQRTVHVPVILPPTPAMAVQIEEGASEVDSGRTHPSMSLAEAASAAGPHALFLPMTARVPICERWPANGSFEGNTEWRMLLGDYAARYADERVWSGTRSLRVGMAPGDNYAGFSSARLPLELTSNWRRASLTVRYLSESGPASDTDQQYIGLLNEAGTYIASVVPSGRRHETTWQTVTYDMQPYIGQTIYLYFGAKNDGSGNSTRLYVDDVALTVCR